MTLNPKRYVYIIDDDAESVTLYSRWCQRIGYEVVAFRSAPEFLREYEDSFHNREHIVLVDMMMPQLSGSQMFNEVRLRNPEAIVIFLTGNRDVELAVKSLKTGAFDYLTKSTEFEEFEARISKAFDFFMVKKENADLEADAFSSNGFFGVSGESDGIRSVYRALKKYGNTNASLLLRGDRGTGLAQIANAIHNVSDRRNEIFVDLDGGEASTQEVQDAALEARGGTLYVANVEGLSSRSQKGILSLMKNDPSVRFIFGTHDNLETHVDSGAFDKALALNICLNTIQMPALKDRLEDVPHLAQVFLKKYAALWARPCLRLSKEALAKVRAYEWPGNCEELDGTIERAVLLSDSKEISEECVRFETDMGENPFDWLQRLDALPTLKEFEFEFIKEALQRSQGRKERAAKILGIGRKTLYRKELELKSREGLSSEQ